MIFFFCIFHTTAEIFSFWCFIADYTIFWAFSTMTLYEYTFFIYFTYFCCLLYKNAKRFSTKLKWKNVLENLSRLKTRDEKNGVWRLKEYFLRFLTAFENASRRYIRRTVNMACVVCIPRVVTEFETTHFTVICAYVYFPNTSRCFLKTIHFLRVKLKCLLMLSKIRTANLTMGKFSNPETTVYILPLEIKYWTILSLPQGEQIIQLIMGFTHLNVNLTIFLILWQPQFFSLLKLKNRTTNRWM